MTNQLLSLLVMGALVGTFASAPMPEPASAPQSLASRPTASGPAVDHRAVAGPGALQPHQPPIPLVRNIAALPTPATSLDLEVLAQDKLDVAAARAAIEADGYRRVSGLGKGIDGAWHAKAYRGTTEVQLTVDGTGRVSIE